jgi:hypothetical protein
MGTVPIALTPSEANDLCLLLRIRAARALTGSGSNRSLKVPHLRRASGPGRPPSAASERALVDRLADGSNVGTWAANSPASGATSATVFAHPQRRSAFSAGACMSMQLAVVPNEIELLRLLGAKMWVRTAVLARRNPCGRGAGRSVQELSNWRRARALRTA